MRKFNNLHLSNSIVIFHDSGRDLSAAFKCISLCSNIATLVKYNDNHDVTKALAVNKQIIASPSRKNNESVFALRNFSPASLAVIVPPYRTTPTA